MIHPRTELRFVHTAIGVGIYASRPIARGTLTWVLDPLDRRLTPAAAAALPAHYHPLVEKYSFRDAGGNFILCWDHARYVNHSCDPNCAGTRHGFDVALRDIAPGEQLTNDYGTLNLLPHEAFACNCGAATCRGWITPEDPGAERKRARESSFAAALAGLGKVEQPLWELAPQGTIAQLLKGVTGDK